MSKQYKLIYSTDLFVTQRVLDLTDLVRVDYLPMQPTNPANPLDVQTSFRSLLTKTSVMPAEKRNSLQTIRFPSLIQPA